MMQMMRGYGCPTSVHRSDKAPEPKKLIVLDGSAHAQFLFQTNQADRVVKEVLRFFVGNQLA